MKAGATRKSAARRAGSAKPAGTAGWSAAQADRTQIRNALRAPADWKAAQAAPAPELATGPGADAAAAAAPADVVRSDGQPLDPSIRRAFEPRFGVGLGDVRVHRDAAAAASAESLSARAYTLGNHVVFNAGSFQPSTAPGRRLLAHELAHVVQQRGSAITGSPALSGSDTHEREARHAARAVERGAHAPALHPAPARIQRDRKDAHDDTDEAQTVVIAPGTPKAMLDQARRLLEHSLDADQQDLLAHAVYQIVGNSIAWYDSAGQLVDQFPIAADADVWSAGIYLAYGENVVQLNFVGGKNQWSQFFAFSPLVIDAQDPKLAGAATGRASQLMSLWLAPADRRRFEQLSARQPNDTLYLIVVPPGGGGGAGTGDAAAAEHVVDQVRRRLRDRAAAATTTAEKPDPRIPDRLVVWSNERGAYVNVWVDGAVEALPVSADETVDQLDQAVGDAAQRLRTSRDAAQSTQIADGAKRTGFVGQDDPDQIKIAGGKTATLPAFPSHIINRTGDITVTGASHSFEMELDLSPAGGDLTSQVFEHLLSVSYRWELIDVTKVKPEDIKAAAETSTDKTQEANNSGDAADVSRDFAAIGEDTTADLDDTLSGDPLTVAATWPARAAWLQVVGISNIVRMGGSLISSLVKKFNRPVNEESIGFDREGEFLVRCIATPMHGDTWARASSVAVSPIKVQNINTRALTANQAPLTRIKQLEAERDRATGEAREQLTAQIDALRRADTESVGDIAASAIDAIDQRIAVTEEVIADNRANKPREQRTAQSRLLAAQLELQQIDLDEYHRSQIKQRDSARAWVALSLIVSSRMPWGSHRAHVTIASEENGQVSDVLTMLGQAQDSAEGRRHYLLADLTSGNPQDRYIFEGRSNQPGLAGHSEAVRNAFVDFRENNGYGRGTIAIRLPASLEAAVGGPLAVETTMRSAPGSHRRVIQRLKDLATAAEIASLFVTGPAAIAIGAVAGVANAIVAVDNLSRRHDAGTLRFDFETIMDISSIVGGFVGVASGPLHGLGKLPGWARRVERIQGLIHIFGVTQLGVSVITIPIQLEQQLIQIENTKGLTPGERAARRAEAFLGAVRSGIVTIATARQMLQPLGGGPEAAAESEPLPEPAGVTGEAPAPIEPAPGADAPAAKPPEAKPPEAKPAEAPEPTIAPAQPARSARVQALEPVLGDLQGKVTIVENPELHGKTARVRYGKDGVRIEIGTEVPPEAQVRAVERHLDTARTLLKYQGPLGAVRRLLSRIVEVLTRIPGYGKQGFESRLEVRKLSEIASSLEQASAALEERMASLGDKDSAQLAREKAAIDRELAEVNQQLELHEAMIDSLDPGLGHVAAYDPRTIANHPALRPQLDAIAVRLKGTLGFDNPHIIDRMDVLQRQGRVRGLEHWIAAAGEQATQPQFIQRIAELGDALTTAESLAPGSVLELVPSTTSPMNAGFTTRISAGDVPAPRTAIEARARAAFTKPGSSPGLATAFDAWVTRERSQGRNPDTTLSRIPEAALTKQVEGLLGGIEAAHAQARLFADLSDLVHPVLKNSIPEDNITIQYENKPPERSEREHAKRLQRHSEEPVVMFGDTRSGMTYPAIDGTIGSPPRPMQLKTFGTTLEPYAARDAAMKALETVKKFNVHGVEFYMEFDGLSMAQIESGWDRPGGASAAQTPPGPVFEGDFVARLQIQCSDGVLRVRFDGTHYHFDKL